MSTERESRGGRHEVTQQLTLRHGAVAVTLTGNLQITDLTAQLMSLDPGGASRIITLPKPIDGLFFDISNCADADEDLDVRNLAGTTIGRLRQEHGSAFFSDGSAWHRTAIYSHRATETKWFNDGVHKDITTAGTPGTPDGTAMGEFGIINIPVDAVVAAVHLHQLADGASGTSALELYRYRADTHLLIASVSLASGGGDFSRTVFTWVDEVYKTLTAGDYLYLQATSVMTAAGKPKGVVDVHFAAGP